MHLNGVDKKTLALVTAVSAACVVAFSAIAVLLYFILGGGSEKAEKKVPLAVHTEEMNGVWIASVINIDFPSSPDLSAAELRSELDDIVRTTAKAGLDTIFFQVRPSADSLYRSEIFPVSVYLSEDGELRLDCLEYLIDSAKKEGIRVHAWINPLRAMVSGSVEDLCDGHPAKENPEWTVKYTDGITWFDCGIPEVRELVAEGVYEIVSNYDVAGVVFDDYFYPYPKYGTDEDGNQVICEFDDSETYAKYGTKFDDIGDWRRDNVNKMVELCYNSVKQADENVLFGVAPFGIWKNGDGGESGSATRGLQSCYDIYCDTVAWVKGGYVDYVAPQIYWSAEESAASYTAICDWWADRLSGSGVGYYICHAAYRYSPDEYSVWSSPQGIMTSQVEYALEKENYLGSIFYGYDAIRNNSNGIADEISRLYSDKNE